MVTNDAGLTLIKSFEGLRLTSYKCPAGVWTIGYGTTHGIKPGMFITQAQADAYLRRDLAEFETAVSKAVHVPVTGNEYAALVSLCYNIGSGAFAKSSLVRRLNAGDHKGAQASFADWNKGGGRVLPGLVRRRAAEAKLFATPDSAVLVEAPAAPPASPAVAPSAPPPVEPVAAPPAPAVSALSAFGSLLVSLFRRKG